MTLTLAFHIAMGVNDLCYKFMFQKLCWNKMLIMFEHVVNAMLDYYDTHTFFLNYVEWLCPKYLWNVCHISTLSMLFCGIPMF